MSEMKRRHFLGTGVAAGAGAGATGTMPRDCQGGHVLAPHRHGGLPQPMVPTLPHRLLRSRKQQPSGSRQSGCKGSWTRSASVWMRSSPRSRESRPRGV